MNKDRELKPCPFCGGKAEDDYGWIFCSKCGVGYDYLDRGKGITDWNKRSYKPLGKEELLEIIKKEVFRQFYKSGVKNIWLEQETLADAIINAWGV